MEQIIALGIASITGVGWFSGKIFNRMRTLEDRIDRMPLEYVLKTRLYSRNGKDE